jgi:AraC family transcriptional regulator
MVVKGGLATYKTYEIKAYVDAHLDSVIRMDALYDIAGLSKGHFHKAFLATFGMNPLTYINGRRVDMACHELEDTEKPLAQIAQDFGYADQPHFTKRFRKVTGMTPRTWRMEYQHATSMQ